MKTHGSLLALFLALGAGALTPGPSLSAQDPAPQVRAAYTGRTMKVELSTALPRSFFVLFVSPRPGPTPTPFGNLQVGRPFFALRWGTTDAAGKALLRVPVPPDPFLAGATVHLAALFAQTGGAAPRVRFSAGKTLTVSGPLILVSCGVGAPGRGSAILFLDLLTLRITGKIPLLRNPTQVLADPYGERGFFAAGSTLFVLDIPGRRILKSFSTSARTSFTSVARDRQGRWFYALAPGTPFFPKPYPAEAAALDMENLQVKGPIRLSNRGIALVPTPLPGRAWAVTMEDRKVHLLDAPTGRILKSLQVGRAGETRAFRAAGVGPSLEVTTGDQSASSPPRLGSVTEVDPWGKAGPPSPLPPYPRVLAPYSLGGKWFFLAACTWKGGSVSPSLHVFSASPLKALGTVPGPWPAGLFQMEASPVLPFAALLWSGNPGYPHTGFLKSGTLALIDLAARKVRVRLTLPKLYQEALHAVTNPTTPVFLYAERPGPRSGARLRILDIPSGKVLPRSADLGRVILFLSDV